MNELSSPNADELRELIHTSMKPGPKNPISISTLCMQLQTHPDNGIQTDIANRRRTHGTNKIPTAKSKPFVRLLLHAFNDVTLIILIIAAVVSLVLGFLHQSDYTNPLERDEAKYSWIEGVFLMASVVTIAFITALNDYSKEKQFDKLKACLKRRQMATVIRGGRLQLIPHEQIIVGDICSVKYGDVIPADGILLNSDNLLVDESSLTGESDSILKKPEEICISSSQVLDGTGKMVILAVGQRSILGEIHTKITDKRLLQRSVLFTKLMRLTVQIGVIAGILALISGLILIVELSFWQYMNAKPFDVAFFKTVTQHLITAVTLLVVGIPEGLPLAVTLALAFCVRRMMTDQNLVRNLESCETMGNCTTICSDKTGTLTQNRMSVVKMYICSENNSLSGSIRDLIGQNISLNSSAARVANVSPNQRLYGNPTECALLEFLETHGIVYRNIRDQFERLVVQVIPFNSTRKFMLTIVRLKSNSSMYRVLVKGASEIIIPKCSRLYKDNEIVALSSGDKSTLAETMDQFGEDGLRTVVLAYKDVNENNYSWNERKDFREFTFLGMFGIADPVRPEVLHAIKCCNNAGDVKQTTTEKPKPNMEKSVLHTKLKTLAIRLGYFGLFIAIATTVVISVHFSIKTFLVDGHPWNNGYFKHYIGHLIVGITLLVVTVPEGLPLAVTISLIYSAKRMMADNNLVRHLDSCETMGSCTTICSDKTGTLTQNRMSVVNCYTSRTVNVESISQELKQLICLVISVNSSYTSQITGGKSLRYQGNQTECALLKYVRDMGWSYERTRSKHPQSQFVRVLPFNASRKMMVTILPFGSSTYRVLVKGAPETLLDKCTAFYGTEGVEELTMDERERLGDVKKSMTDSGLRVICLAYRDVGENKAFLLVNADESLIVKELVFLALLGIEDPVREEVPFAIKICQGAGVTVRMVTGDNKNTARVIAIKCGILKPQDDYLVLDSAEFNRMIRDDNNEVQQHLLDKVWPRLRVLARSTPVDKYVLVSGIIDSRITKYREVVAVTGDGTNDGPALRRADVGFAMGICGTDVAKEAADIILTDDNFNSIVKALMWGRNAYDSIAKFLQFQLTVNVVAVTIVFVSACVIQNSPLKAVQMLWVNLIMDTLASLALATELPTPDLLKRKPYGRTKPLISTTMYKNILGQAVYQLTITFGLLFFGHDLLDLPFDNYESAREGVVATEHFTVIFNTFVMMTLFNEINSRKIHGERNVFKGLCSNPAFYVIWLTTFFVQFALVQYGGAVMFTKPLSLTLWWVCVFFGVGTLLWTQLLISIPTFNFCRQRNEDNYDNNTQ